MQKLRLPKVQLLLGGLFLLVGCLMVVPASVLAQTPPDQTTQTSTSDQTTGNPQSTGNPQDLNSGGETIQEGLCQGANLEVGTTCQSGGITDAEAQTKVNNLIKTVINLFSVVVGVVSVIMIIIGGLKYITSGGDSTSVAGAKNTILYAIIGLIIVALAQVMVQFVLGKVSQA